VDPKKLTIEVTYRQYPPDLEALSTEDRDNVDPRTFAALTILNVTVNGKDITDTKVETDKRPPEEYWDLFTTGTHFLELRSIDNS